MTTIYFHAKYVFPNLASSYSQVSLLLEFQFRNPPMCQYPYPKYIDNQIVSALDFSCCDYKSDQILLHISVQITYSYTDLLYSPSYGSYGASLIHTYDNPQSYVNFAKDFRNILLLVVILRVGR